MEGIKCRYIATNQTKMFILRYGRFSLIEREREREREVGT